MSTWPYSSGRSRQPAVDRPLRPDAAALSACPRCAGVNLRPNGHYQSARDGETKDAVVCRDCGRSFYLRLGLHLPKSVRRVQAEKFVLADDHRPTCPFCSGTDVNRRGLIHLATGGTTQRWRCRPCGRRFVSRAHRVAVLDRRAVSHFESIAPHDEALFLFHFAKRSGNFEEMLQVISISDRETMWLQFLVTVNALDKSEVEAAIAFRDAVFREFNLLLVGEQEGVLLT